jgi:hypothetical protein
MELSHDGIETVDHKHSKAKPNRLPGVGSSDLVRHPNVHHSKISGPDLHTRSSCRPATARQCNRETREKKSSTFRKINSWTSTEGNEGNKDGSPPPSLSSLASVQTSSVARRRTIQLTDRHDLTYEYHKTPRQIPKRKWRFGAAPRSAYDLYQKR